MQEVHTLTRLGVPSTVVRRRWMFGFQRRRVRRCENETLLPKTGPLPHTSQTEATVRSILIRVTGLYGDAGSAVGGSGSRRSLPDVLALVRTERIVGGRFYAARCEHAPRTVAAVARPQDGRQARGDLRPAHSRRPAAALPAPLLHPRRADRPVLAARGRPRHRAGAGGDGGRDPAA